MTELSAATPPETIRGLLQTLQDDGLLDYFVTTEPLGESWVLGIQGQILKLDAEQVAVFLIANQATLGWIIRTAQAHGANYVFGHSSSS